MLTTIMPEPLRSGKAREPRRTFRRTEWSVIASHPAHSLHSKPMRQTALTFRFMLVLWLIAPTLAAACELARQGDGRVAAVIDARTLRLEDGRDIRLTGLAPLTSDHASVATALLAALVIGRDVTIHAGSDAPDRYGRQHASLRLDINGPSIQAMLAAQGGALADGQSHDACAAEIRAAEADARQDRLGIWASAAVIKNTERPGDILAGLGRFAIVEGRVVSVRRAGSVTYVNFGRRWTADFTVTISGRVLPQLAAAGLQPQAFEGQRLRVRGIIEQRGGSPTGSPTKSPRIEVIRPGQIEIVGADVVAGASE